MINNIRSWLQPHPTVQFIWIKLMNDAARYHIKLALIFILLSAATTVAFPYGIGLMLQGAQSADLFVLVTGILLFTGLQAIDHVSSYFRMTNREEFFQEIFIYAPEQLTRMFWRRTLKKLIAEDTELDGGSVEGTLERVHNIVSGYVYTLIPNAAAVIIASIACFFADWRLGLVVLCYIALDHFFGVRDNAFILKKARPIEKRIRRWRRQIRERWEDTPTIKTNGVEDRYIKQLRSEGERMMRADRSLWKFAVPWMAMRRRGFAWFFTAIIFGSAGYLVFGGSMSIANFVLLVFSFLRVLESLMEIGEADREIQRNITRVDEVRVVLSQEDDFLYDEGKLFTDDSVGVTFKNVSLSLGEGGEKRNILRDVNFSIPAGKKVGIVGPSGAGKTQIIYLLLRAFDPTHGSILINDTPLHELMPASYLQRIGYAQQDSKVHEGSVASNVELGLSHATHDSDCIWNTISASGLHFGDRLTKGLQTAVGYSGLRFSGGQRQRLSIARSLRKLYVDMKKRGLIIWDEGTSALDSLAEDHVLNNLYHGLPDGTTVIQTAHRLGTLQRCDFIIFVRPLGDCTKITEQVTTHESMWDLYQTDDLFREMCIKQKFMPLRQKVE